MALNKIIRQRRIEYKKVRCIFVALVAKRKQGQSTQQLISEFKKLTYEDQGLDKVRTVGMSGFLKPSKVKNIKMTELRKASARIRRRNKRNAGITK